MSKTLKKQELDLQTLVAQLQAQAEDGEIDQNLIDQIAAAVNVTVEPAAPAETVAQAVEAAPPVTQPDPVAAPEPEEAEKIYSARPPRSMFSESDRDEDDRRQLPEFIKALESGSVKKAQAISGIGGFDRMFNLACRALLTEGGYTYQNVKKLHAGAPEQLDLKKGAIVANDYAGMYLMRLAKLMMPVYAGLRRRFPTTTPTTGSDQAVWKTQIGFQNLNRANLMSVAEGSVGDAMNESPTVFTTPYRDIALNDAVTLKATAASRGFDDPLQIAVIRTLTALLEGEERKILGDNYAAIAKPASLTAVGGGTGTLGNNNDKFIVSALTYRGWLAGSTGGASAVGETDGTLSDAVDISGSANVTLTWGAVRGAVAYNLFYNPAGHATNKYYIGTYTKNSVTLTSLPSSGNSPSATNVSANANGMEGLISWCGLSTIYSKSIPGKATWKDNAGATLTAGTSGIVQLDEILADLWTKWNIAPTLLVMSPLMVGALTDKILGMNSGAMYRIEVSQERGTIQGGAFLSGYVNKFAPFADGTPRMMDIIPHPYMPDGMVNFLCETIPYPMSREARGFAIETLIPYTYFPLAASTIQYPFALTVSEVLECFHPAAQTQLVGVALA